MKFLGKYLVRNERLVVAASEVRYRTRDGRSFLLIVLCGWFIFGLINAGDAGSLMALMASLMSLPVLARLLWPTDVIIRPQLHSLKFGYWFAGVIPRFKTFDHTQVQSVAIATYEVELKDQPIKRTFAPVLFLKSGVYSDLPAFEDESWARRIAAAVAPGRVVGTLNADAAAPIAKAQIDGVHRLFYRMIGLGAISVVMIALPAWQLLVATVYEPKNTYVASVTGQREICEYSWSADKGYVYRLGECGTVPPKPFSAVAAAPSVERMPELSLAIKDHYGQSQSGTIVVSSKIGLQAVKSGVLEVVFWPEAKRTFSLPTRDWVSFHLNVMGIGLVLLVLIEAIIRWFYPRLNLHVPAMAQA